MYNMLLLYSELRSAIAIQQECYILASKIIYVL